jgi:hypothetical protein
VGYFYFSEGWEKKIEVFNWAAEKNTLLQALVRGWLQAACKSVFFLCVACLLGFVMEDLSSVMQELKMSCEKCLADSEKLKVSADCSQF